MNHTSGRKFDVLPSEYELFQFTVPKSTTLNVRLWATDPVDVLFLNTQDLADYKSGNPRHSYWKAWGRRIDLEDEIQVDPGTWYITIEGRERPASGRLEVYQ